MLHELLGRERAGIERGVDVGDARRGEIERGGVGGGCRESGQDDEESLHGALSAGFTAD